MVKILEKNKYLIFNLLICFFTIGCQSNDIDLAIEKYENGKYLESIDILNSCIKKDTTNSISYQYRGLCYYMLNQHDNALIDLENYYFKETDHDTATLFIMSKIYYEKMQYVNSIILCDELESKGYNKINIQLYHYRGKSYLYMDDLRKGFQDIKKFYLNDSNNYEACNDMGYYYYLNEKYDSSISYYSKAITGNDKSYSLYFNRGNCYLKTEKYEKAILDYQKALLLNNNIPSIHNNLAAAYYLLSNKEDACKHFKIAFDLGDRSVLDNIKKCCPDNS